MLPLIYLRVDVDCVLFLAVCTESDGKLSRGLGTRLQFCVSYIDMAAHVYTCMCV